jgi:hypothetical protein
VRIFNFIILIITSLVLTGCGDDKAANSESAPAADSAMTESSAEMAMDDVYGRTIDHTRDAAEFELRRSIAGHDRMIEQYTADGHATDELEAHKAELSASLDALLNSG